MFDTLVGLFKINNTRRKLASRNQLCCIMMAKSYSVATYFVKLSQLRDQINTIGDTIEYVKFVIVTLNGFSSSWEPFVHSICGQEEFPKFDRLWNNYFQEEARSLSKNNLQKPHDEGSQALASHARKGK